MLRSKGLGIALTAAVAFAACVLPARAGDILAEGVKAPDFNLPSQEDTAVSLTQYKGKWVVLYFYPKDMTTGCTIEAHKFQDALPKLSALNAVVLRRLARHRREPSSARPSAPKTRSPSSCSRTPDHKVIDALRAYPVTARGDNKFAQRDTFLISPEGKIVKVWTGVNPNTHTDDVLAAIAAAKN